MLRCVALRGGGRYTDMDIDIRERNTTNTTGVVFRSCTHSHTHTHWHTTIHQAD